jgi:hypothetical protein
VTPEIIGSTTCVTWATLKISEVVVGCLVGGGTATVTAIEVCMVNSVRSCSLTILGVHAETSAMHDGYILMNELEIPMRDSHRFEYMHPIQEYDHPSSLLGNSH